MAIKSGFGIFRIKAVDEEKRIIRGIASTPTLDRQGDIVEPLGMSYQTMPKLMLYHNHTLPVGSVVKLTPTKRGVEFEAHIPTVTEEGTVKARVDEAFHSLKYNLISAVSVGFRVLEHEVLKTGGWLIKSWELLEISLVPVPAQSEAVITGIKSLDAEIRASMGGGKKADKTASEVSEKKIKTVKISKTKENDMKISEKLKAFRDTLAEKQAKIAEMAEKSADATFDAADQEAFDTLVSEVDEVQKHIERLELAEKAAKASAKPVTEEAGKTEKAAFAAREGVASVSVKGANVKKGARFARYAMAMAAGRGSIADAVTFSEKNWGSSTPEVTDYIKAVAGTTTSPTWAAPLVDQANIVGEFVELLRPETLLGKMNGFRNVPFNVKIPVQTGGSTIGWVGEGAVKPVSELAFDTITLGHNKVAGIVVLTDELARFSNPDAEATVQRDLIEQSAQFLDDAFINPANTATPGVRPAAVTVGATNISASGTDFDAFLCDLAALQEAFLTANMSPAGAYLVMSSVQAARLAMFRSVMGQYEFPQLSANGGSLGGFTVVTSENVPTNSAGESIISLVKPSEILLADDGNVTLDASREATLDMNGSTTPNFSLWQRNCVGIRAERYITWAKRRANAVAYISDANYTTCTSS